MSDQQDIREELQRHVLRQSGMKASEVKEDNKRKGGSSDVDRMERREDSDVSRCTKIKISIN